MVADILVDMEVDKVADMAVKTDKLSQNSCKQEKCWKNGKMKNAPK